MENNNTVVVAVCGKGGVGKTCISALLTKILCADNNNKVLAIDADPAVGLASSLGITIKKTLDDIRTGLITNIKDEKNIPKKELLATIDYELFEALVERQNLAFLAIGRPETAGCYCKINSFLREIIKEMVPNFDYVIIDGEAGIEQVNRRVMGMVTHLLLVTDTSLKGKNVAETIENVAQRSISYKKKGLILNMMKEMAHLDAFRQKTALPIIGWLPEDDLIRHYDREGTSFFELGPSEAQKALEKIATDFLTPGE
ncbi:AAA family ATPase [candidate division CSSED10-310 bacterium]|uniref:AAA family ATPase n=1 Tax=candidate division CSSED10-310 bacterium TaxID=2855610 RepID=A0ABV6YRF8_UNCC1